MTDPTFITHEVAAEAFCDTFRRRVGPGPGKVRLDELADRLEIDARTVKAWRDGEGVAGKAWRGRRGGDIGLPVFVGHPEGA